jgi:hypothetical protein
MFEKEIEFIYKYNLSKIKHLGSFITYEQLISTNIHPALLQYLSAEIDFLIYEDRQKLLKDSIFDYSGDKIVDHFSSISEEIKRSKKFSFEYLSKLLLHASSFNTNFIIRPKWSLMQFVFENENGPTKQIVEVKQILNYLYYYPYLKRLLVNFFIKKRLISISSSELKELLDKIDKINYESNFDKVIDNAFTCMLEFINTGEIKNKKISKQFVELFLEDKGLSHIQNVLSEKFKNSNVDKYDISEFKNIILNYEPEEETTTNSIEDEDGVSIDNETTENVEEVYNNSDKNSTETPTVDSNDLNAEDIAEQQGKSNPKIELIENEDVVRETRNDISEINIQEAEESPDEKKSFLESHMDSLVDEDENDVEIEVAEEPVSEDDDEHEPPEIDEAPRVDEENIDEIYALATEEEKIDSFVEEDSANLARVEIGDDEDDEDPFDEKNGNVEEVAEVNESNEESVEEVEENDLDAYIEQGTSITFSSDELVIPNEEAAEDLKTEADPITEIDEWPSKSSNLNDISDNISSIVDEDIVEDEITESIPDKIDFEMPSVIESMLNKKEADIDIQDADDMGMDDENDLQLDADDNQDVEEKAEDTANQQTLFNVDYLDKYLDISEGLDIVEPKESVPEVEEITESAEQSIDISQLLENKKITKIIEVVFDYDMEDFANAIDKISEATSQSEANAVIDEIAKKSYIDSSVKEIKVFKNIISEYIK